MERKAPDGCEGVVMNAPFKLAAEFIAHALDLCPLVIALARLAFMESERRTPILEGRGLARIHVFRKRLPMMHRHGWEGRKANCGDGVWLVRLGSQPYGADDDRSDLVGATMTRRNQPEAATPTRADRAPTVVRSRRCVVDPHPQWRMAIANRSRDLQVAWRPGGQSRPADHPRRSAAVPRTQGARPQPQPRAD